MAMTINEGGTIEAPYEVSGPNDPNATPAPGDQTPEGDKSVGVDGAEPQNPGGEPKPDTDQEGDKPTDDDAGLDAVAKTLKSAGLDMNEFTQEFTEKGGLSEESFTKLEAAGFPRALVEQYLAGAQVNVTLAKEQEAQIKGLVGGPEAYTEMAQWAAKNVPADDLDAYNKIMASGDLKSIKFAVAGLKARYDAQAEVEPNLLHGNSRAQARQADVFQSSAEVVSAMKDPRYGKDPAYTKAIEQKLGRSNVF